MRHQRELSMTALAAALVLAAVPAAADDCAPFACGQRWVSIELIVYADERGGDACNDGVAVGRIGTVVDPQTHEFFLFGSSEEAVVILELDDGSTVETRPHQFDSVADEPEAVVEWARRAYGSAPPGSTKRLAHLFYYTALRDPGYSLCGRVEESTSFVSADGIDRPIYYIERAGETGASPYGDLFADFPSFDIEAIHGTRVSEEDRIRVTYRGRHADIELLPTKGCCLAGGRCEEVDAGEACPEETIEETASCLECRCPSPPCYLTEDTVRACCLADGCQDLTGEQCGLAGGVPFAKGSSCGGERAVDCSSVRSSGGCCGPDGVCDVVDKNACPADRPFFPGACPPSCPTQPAEAEPARGCCLGGQCLDVDPETCVSLAEDGSAVVLDHPCAPAGQPTPGCSTPPTEVGACRRVSGECVEGMTEVECEAEPTLGTWLGPGTCPQTGACCQGPGSCSATTEAECPRGPSQLFFPGATCDDDPCAELGGCCGTAGGCLLVRPDECQTPLTFLSGGCAEGCPEVGSCTLVCPTSGSRICRPTSRPTCDEAGGGFEAGFLCEPSECPPTPCDPAAGEWFDECGRVVLTAEGGVLATGLEGAEGSWTCRAAPGSSAAPILDLVWENGSAEARALRQDGRSQLLEKPEADDSPWERAPVEPPATGELFHLYSGLPTPVTLRRTNCGGDPVAVAGLEYAGEDGRWSSSPPDWLRARPAAELPRSAKPRQRAEALFFLEVLPEAKEGDWTRIRLGGPEGAGVTSHLVFVQARMKKVEMKVDTEPKGDPR